MTANDYGSILAAWKMKAPLDLAALSGGLARTELEIGFGNGEFTALRAHSEPQTLFVGLEVSASCAVRCARRASGLNNLKIICTDARFMMKEFFADASLDRVYMNFPCPWPKKRHARRRVTDIDFANALAAVLKPRGVFELVTDEEWYAQDALDTLGRHAALSAAGYETNPARPVTTKYERKWLEMGKSIYRLTVTKTKDFTVDRWTWGVEEMHVKTGKPLPAGALESLFGASGNRESARWVFKKHYAAPETTSEKAFLIETVSTDDEFEQRFYLKVAERGGETLVKLDGTAKAYLTPAVRFAIEDLGNRLSGSGSIS